MREIPFLPNLFLCLLLPCMTLAQPRDEKTAFNLEAENLYHQATARQDAGDLDAAADLYTRALAIDARLLPAWYNLGLVHYEMKHYRKAEEALDKLIELSPADTANYELYGLVLFHTGHYDRAIASFTLVLNAEPTDERYINRALAYLNTGRDQQALSDYEEALRLNGNNVSACMGKGIALNNLGQCELALTWFDRALEISPDNPDVLSNRAIAYFQAGQREKSLEDFRNALALERKSGIYAARARCFLLAGNPAEAWYDIREALHFEPDAPELLELAGEIEWERGNLAAGMEYFTKVLQKDPENNRCYFKRSKLYLQNHQFYEAISDLYRVLDLDPFNKEARLSLLHAYSQLDRENLSAMATK